MLEEVTPTCQDIARQTVGFNYQSLYVRVERSNRKPRIIARTNIFIVEMGIKISKIGR
ncbi:predicted protein [Histoplasma mississippiense (nom. inval.)]|uniref:predicted protein n=1 Tax=Ajellomyces capsulatus (strain NAm1 / WU24) TaxID=2059318 RepID=UPI000157B506|nr:predicted protein [Histoplasma mississippiense (nom. inval.)]EDN02821.1 predicted protein [Histoplasma mississippiense (nom. inval.)]